MRKDEVKIRKATRRDLPQLLNLSKELRRYHRRFSGFEALHKDARKRWTKFALKNIRSPNGLVLVAEQDNKLIGYALGLVKKNIPIYKLEKIGHFSDLFVTSSLRGKGVASLLKKEMFKWFRAKKLPMAKIHVHAENNYARAVYKKWKFNDFHIVMRRKL
jgi:GNAT superfamily N-acetyltransferase